MQSALVGSWHNSGFYGHYRGQFKSESAREYRLAAKPQPPAVFLQRSQAPRAGRTTPVSGNQWSLLLLQDSKFPESELEATTKEPAQQHFFSKHDNRTSFDKGIGRRKNLERLWQKHTFLCWAPCELEFHQQRPLESSYQANFRSGPGPGGLPQRLVHFVQIQPHYASTTYQENFCQPSPGDHYGSNSVRPQAAVTNALPKLPEIPKPKLLQHYLHAGVSECLNWSRALNKNG